MFLNNNNNNIIVIIIIMMSELTCHLWLRWVYVSPLVCKALSLYRPRVTVDSTNWVASLGI